MFRGDQMNNLFEFAMLHCNGDLLNLQVNGKLNFNLKLHNYLHDFGI